MGFDKIELMNSIRITSHSPVRIWNNFNLLRSLIRCALSMEFVLLLCLVDFFFCLVYLLFVGEDVGFR